MKSRPGCVIAALCAVMFASLPGRRAEASVALLMEEPYGKFGAFNPTGHAAMYLNHVCAESPTELRMCHDGEYGVVISRYHKMDGYDWIAVPLIPYLYAVNSIDEIPVTVDKAQVAELRDAYRRAHLERLAPDTDKGAAPKGEWAQLVGASYDRTIHGFQVETTQEQDERFIAYVNDRKNVGHFNLFLHNCADFSRVALDMYFPHAIHRNFIADAGLTTPKQVARSLVSYGKKHPELKMTAFVIPQVPGNMRRSHSVDGVAESLVKSKKYIIPLVALNPEVSGAIVVAYLVDGRLKMPKDAMVFQIDDVEVTDSAVDRAATPAGTRTALRLPTAGTGAQNH
ncbi:hypothetical protein [Edaphobacter modestus]|uniref:DUF4105 domain-containing protein n=1 Tax=Edaphobacter modestus TaxID=388466 RepID=A0A4Q7YZE0_9BACT|nr:hypothetical protein [Edaphobacter modestus]RZU43168.1 hypothetical protein BDD14_4799 [Edaphobacter modestus]